MKALLKKVNFFVWVFERFFSAAHSLSVWVEVARVTATVIAPGRDRRTIVFGIDLSQAPPTQGDFLNLLVLARVLTKLGLTPRVQHWASDEQLPASWQEVGLSSYSDMLARWNELDNWLGSPIKGLREWRETERAVNKDESFLRLPSFAFVIPRALNVLWFLFPSQEVRDAFFLDEFKFDTEELAGMGLSGEFVTLNVRNSSYDRSRNLSGEELVTYLKLALARHSDSTVVILMDHSDSNLIFSDSLEKGDIMRVMLQPAPGFVGAARLLLSSHHYYQRLGGGLNFVATFSRVPYEISVQSIYGTPRPVRNRWAPWSAANQSVRIQQT